MGDMSKRHDDSDDLGPSGRIDVRDAWEEARAARELAVEVDSALTSMQQSFQRNLTQLRDDFRDFSHRFELFEQAQQSTGTREIERLNVHAKRLSDLEDWQRTVQTWMDEIRGSFRALQWVGGGLGVLLTMLTILQLMDRFG